MSKFKGGKVGSLKRLKQDLDASSNASSTVWIRYIGMNKEMQVRFLTEPDEWFRYFEHYDAVLKYFPCTGDDCVGCESEVEKTARASKRYLATVLDVERDRVVPLKLPNDLANRVLIRFERYGTLLDRDYTLAREGTGRETTYDVDSHAPSAIGKKYELLDLSKVLEDALADTFGNEDEDEDEPKKKPAKKKAATKKAKPEPVVEDDDDDLEEEVAWPERDEDEEEPEGDIVVAEDDDASEDEEVLILDEDDLLGMTVAQLKDIASEVGVTLSAGMRKTALVNAILDAAEEADD